MPWMKWVRLDDAIDGNVKRPLSKKPGGVYEIATRKPICRFLGTDPDGILIIGRTAGETQSLSIRVGALFNAAYKGKGGHSEGDRFNILRLHLKVGPLWVRWVEKNRRSPVDLEDKLLTQYQRKFGELPPLNNSGGV